ncbi:RALBP1 associated Eps domain containing isoform X2 [Arctopsyche grandis]|uniref:RALBP1 associated Eps domain containing isoform X2 n=1 Tax=Arctopsyche grandis TaxID=121162 RepID=UPI00406D7407
MDELRLSETEQRYFGDLFVCCDEQANGAVPILKATELFRSAGLHDDTLKQIAEISYASPTNTTHINRKEFYSALKLVAAHQANMPLRLEILTSPVDLPLPRFTWNLNSEGEPDLIQLSNSPIVAGQKAELRLHHKRDKSFRSYEPMRLSSSDVEAPPGSSLHDNVESQSTDSEVESETISQHSEHSHTMRAKNGSPWSTASESPTPTNSVADQRAQGLLGPHAPWTSTSGPNRGRWPAMSIGEEHTQLLEEESSDRHSSDEEGGDTEGDRSFSRSVWRVSPEQRLHYVGQFQLLQPDVHSLVPGSIARRFFEKSRLPVTDLRKIWLLSDVTKDGALCIEEFITAMHLVVLRRKDIPVPDVLPQCLVPKVQKSPVRSPEQIVTSNLVDLGSSSNINISTEFNSKLPTIPLPNAKPPPNDIDSFESKNLKTLNLDDSSPSLSSPVVGEAPIRNKPEALSGNKEWTKFIDSPTSSIASPGPKPVNFDFHKSAVERDPKIFHPVPLRVTPEASSLPIQSSDSGGTSPRKLEDLACNFQDSHEVASPKKLSAQLSCDINSLPSVQASSAEFKPIQRPQAKKPVLKNIGAIPPPPTKEVPCISEDISGPVSLQYAPKKDPPPPPPPRPLRTHTRSSSLDLNRLKGSHVVVANPPPQIPPRISPSITSPQSKKLINQRSEGDVLGLIADPPFSPCDAFSQNTQTSQNFNEIEESIETFANFAQFQNNLPLPAVESSAPINLPRTRASFDDIETHVPRKHGAFEVYRKPTPRNSESPETSNLGDHSSNSILGIRSDDSLRKLQEQNSLLCRLCQELSLELADVQRERETLKLRLESNSTVV